MKIFQPDEGDLDEGFATSFTFDDSDEMKAFRKWLESMGIDHLKSKFPVIEDGKVRYQTGIVVQAPTEEEEEVEEVVEEVVVEEKPKKKKSRKSEPEPEPEE
jgi:hypothetical protein